MTEAPERITYLRDFGTAITYELHRSVLYKLQYPPVEYVRVDKLEELKAENEHLRTQVASLKEGWRLADDNRIAAEKERDEWKAAYREACDNYADLLQRTNAGDKDV